MNLRSSYRLASIVAFSSVLLGCAGTSAPANPEVTRTPPPQDFEKTISNYFAFRVRGPQKNTVINFAAPEPGACPLDGYLTSMRGWVVPVVYSTRSGQGLSTVNIDAKQYYFWFLGNTIAGITPRLDLCPGVGANLTELSPPMAPMGRLATAAVPAPRGPEVERRSVVDAPAPALRKRATDRPKTAAGGKKTSRHTPRGATPAIALQPPP